MSGVQEFFTALGSQLLDKIKIGGRDISQGIKEAINFEPLFYVRIGGFAIPVTATMISIFFTVLILLVVAIVFARRLNLKPGKKQAAAESLLDSVLGLCKSNGLNDEQARVVMPWALSLGLYIIVSNLVAVIGLKPASRNPVFPVTLALFTLLFVIVMGIYFTGLKGFCYSLLNPMPAMLPFSLLDYVIKPISLAFRLFGNVFGAYILLEFVALVVPLALPAVLGLWFDVGDGIIQGAIFMFLSINYIGEIVEKAAATETAVQAKRAKKAAKKQAKEVL